MSDVDTELWVTESYLQMQERIAARLLGLTPEDSDRARHEVSLYGAFSGLRRCLDERANCVRQDSGPLAGPSTLGSGQANADRPPIGEGGERNRPSAQRIKARSRKSGGSRKKSAIKQIEYCIHKLRLIRRSVNTLGERDVHQDGASLGVPSLSNKVNALGAARWHKIPWTRGTTNQMLKQRMGVPLYELCFAESKLVRQRAKELGYNKSLTWGKMCIIERLTFALKILRSHGVSSISATSPTPI